MIARLLAATLVPLQETPQPVLPPLREVAAAEALPGALAQLSSERLRGHVAFLAADALRGRCAGEAGCRAAASYLANELERLGLKPGAGDSYLQPFSFKVGRRQLIETANVVGVLDGCDPELRDEIVVLGAHYDHVGTAASRSPGRSGRARGGDDIWNGADDNASGTSAVLEIAEAISSSGLKTRRTLVFALFSGEEFNLYGSAHYCADPVGRTVAMVNLDMIGRNPHLPVEVSGTSTLQDGLWEVLLDGARDAAPKLSLKLVPETVEASDDYSFVRARVPAIALFSGYHPQYHRANDHIGFIDFARLREIAGFSLALLALLGDTREPLRFAPSRANPESRQLGIAVEVLSESERQDLKPGRGGVRVTEVEPDSVAERAGVEVGDVVISIRDRPLPADSPDRALQRAALRAAYSRDHPLEVLRGGRTVPLQFRFERR